MDYDVYCAIVERVKEIAGEDDGTKHAFIEDIMAVCKRYHDEGMNLPLSARTLVFTASSMMVLMADLEDAEAFARYVRDGAETTRKIISEHWPPPERTKWPYA